MGSGAGDIWNLNGVRPGFGPVQVLSVSEFMVCRSSGLNIGPGVVPMG